MTPKVVNRRKRPRGCDPVYVGRPTRWGNPFKVGRHGSREQVIAKYRMWLMAQPELVEAARLELRGRDLECWCVPLPCHADVLLEVANGGDSECEKLANELTNVNAKGGDGG